MADGDLDRPLVERRNPIVVAWAAVGALLFVVTMSVVAYSSVRSAAWSSIPFFACGVAFVWFMVRNLRRTTWWFAADRSSVVVRPVLGATVREPLSAVDAVELTATHQVKLTMVDGRVVDLTGTIGRVRGADVELAEAIAELGVPKGGLGFRSEP